jgi:hypothetical protein
MAVGIEEHSAVSPTHVQPAIMARVQRIHERIHGHGANPQSEPHTLAYSIVYFTTVAFLLALCVEAAFR